ncbi:MAG: hypothetical protein H0W90_15290 [Actinobacteria bacterium]|nr:hypothetical protein [Actinomycetota bacterium]
MSAGRYPVSVYERADDSSSVMPVWDLGPYRIWMQVRPDSSGSRSEILGAILNGLTVSLDRQGIPRASIRNGLVQGNPITNPLNRDQVMFYAPDGDVPWSVVFRRDNALAQEGTAVTENLAITSVATSTGITVTCDGPAAASKSVEETAHAVAASLRAVR